MDRRRALLGAGRRRGHRPATSDVDHLRQPQPHRHADQAVAAPASATRRRRRRACGGWSSNIELLGGRANPDGGIDLEVGANFLVLESRARGNHLWAGRTTYRLRRVDGELRMAYKKVVLVDNDRPLPTLGFLI